MKIRTVVAMAAMLLSANAANATTYVGSLVAGGTTTDFTIDTDGTLGALSLANLTSWSGVISQGSNSVAIGSALSGVFVNQGANGSGLFATASQLTFDPTLNQVGFLLGRGVSGTFAYICITGQATNCNGVSSAIVLAFDQNVGNVKSAPVTETFVVARAVNGGVPEPASWGLMIVGLGLTGAAMRRRTAAATAS